MIPELNQAMALLQEVIEDNTVSKNIKAAADSCIKILKDETCETCVKCDRAIQVLNITDDPNMNMYTKTLIWQVISLLESQI